MADFQSGVDVANAGNATGFSRVLRGLGLITICIVGLLVLGKFTPLPAEALAAVSVPALVVFVGPGLMLILAGLVEAVAGTKWTELGAVTRVLLLIVGIPLICAALFFGAGFTASYIDDHLSGIADPPVSHTVSVLGQFWMGR